MHYVVAGAGYLGRRVLAALPAGTATSLSRSDPGIAGVDAVRVDFDDEQPTQINLPSPFRLLYTVPPPSSGDTDPRLDRLLGRLATPPERFVYISTTGVYGDRNGASVTEEDTVSPATDRARRRVAAENAARAWCGAHDLPCVLLRVPGIYGPGRLGLERIRAGTEVLDEADAGPGNRIHVDDLVSCCLAAMTGAAPAGIYNVGDGDHRSASSFTRSVARLAGLPEPAAITLADAEEHWSPMRLSFARESRRVETRKMRELLGVMPAYADPEDGIRASLAAEDSD